MKTTENKPPAGRSVISIAVALLVGALMTVAGSYRGLDIGPLPAFAACAALAFALQWVAFVPAYLAQTETFYDLTGSITYLSVMLLAVTAKADPRSLLLAGLIALWALRLGSFLFLRIRADGGDQRFERIKPFFLRFLSTWTLQGLWVLMTAAAAIAAMTSPHSLPLGAPASAGLLLWIAGFAIEVIADAQKRAFRRDPANAGRYIDSGLWAWSRHPNYFGEILLWVGIAVIALPALEGWQYATLLSPLFVYLLLTRVSGIPMLEARARRQWGEDPAWQAYRQRTPALFPRPPRRAQ